MSTTRTTPRHALVEALRDAVAVCLETQRAYDDLDVRDAADEIAAALEIIKAEHLAEADARETGACFDDDERASDDYVSKVWQVGPIEDDDVAENLES